MRILLISALIWAVGSVEAHSQVEPTLTSHQRAAAELIDILQLEQTASTATDIIARVVAGQNQMSAELIDVIIAFGKEFAPWELMRAEYVRIYCAAYTEGELRELISFYNTPVGRKTLEIAPDLMRQSIEIRQKLIQQHLPELQRRMLRVRPGGE